ncbi:MAG: hypothetical protein JWL59_1602 [Chthoniobacteraceae bacterium]|nr:hypothetical protein [Chthoniobacteraceae bacterium]
MKTVTRQKVAATRLGWLLVSIGMYMLAHASACKAQLLEDVVWQAAGSTLPDYPGSGAGSQLSKTYGTAAWNADAVSNNRVEGDGFVQFKVDSLSYRVAVGLSNANTNQSYTSIDHAIVFNVTSTFAYSSGAFVIRDGGSNSLVFGAGSFTTSDVFKIERVGCLTKYWKGTTLLYTSTNSAAYRSVGSLMVDTSFMEVGGSISACKMQSVPEEDVIWDEVVGVIPKYTAGTAVPDQGSRLDHSTAATTWEGAVSSKTISGDGYVKFSFGVTGKIMAAGLAVVNPDQGSTNIPYRIEATGSAGNFNVMEGATLRATGTFVAGDMFTVTRVGSTVTYTQNGNFLYANSAATTVPLVVDTAFYSASGYITNCRFGGVAKVERVTWNTASNVSATYLNQAARSKLAKTAFTTAWDSGATSVKGIIRGGFVRFQFAQTTKNVAVGLSDVDGGVTNTSIKLALQASSAGMVQVMESGVALGSAVSYTTSDVFTVQRAGNRVIYLKNGTPIQSHSLINGQAALASAPLIVDSSFYENGGAIVNCEASGFPADIYWRDLNQTDVTYDSITSFSVTPGMIGTGSRLNKTSTTTGYNADAISRSTFSGDGFFQFRIQQTNKVLWMGLANRNDGPSAGTAYLTYSFYFDTPGHYYARFFGTNLAEGTYGANDVFRIERNNQLPKFFRNGVLVATDTNPCNYRFFADTLFYTAGAASAVSDAVTYTASADSDGDGINDAWEYQYFGSLAQDAIDNNGAAANYDGDAYTNLEESQLGLNPTDYYNGAPAYLEKVNGDAQTSPVNLWTALPLGVKVWSNPLPPPGGSLPMAAAPVTFSVTPVGGKFSLTASGAGSDTLSLHTDLSTGLGQVYFLQPAPGVVSTITATAKPDPAPPGGLSAAAAGSVTFTHQADLLLALWKFDEGAGITVNDSSSSSPLNSGTLSGSVIKQSSFKGNGTLSDGALKFDGANGYVNVPSQSSQTLGATVSISAWLQLDVNMAMGADTDIYPILSKGDTSGPAFVFAVKGGAGGKGLSFRILNAGSTVAELVPGSDQRSLLGDNHPHLVAFTRDASNQGRIYIDGALVAGPLSMAGTLNPTTAQPIWIGKDLSGRYFKGLLENVALYGNPLSASEMQYSIDVDLDGLPDWWETKYFSNFTSQNGGGNFDADAYTNLQEYQLGFDPKDASNLLAAWRFDEGVGTAANDSSSSYPPNAGLLLTGATKQASFKGAGTLADGAVKFDGVSGYINVPHQPTQTLGTTFSVTAWVQLDAGTPLAADTDLYPILSKGDASGAAFSFVIKGGTGKGLSFRIFNLGSLVAELVPTNDQSILLRDNHPHFVGFTRDSSNQGRLYIDGVLVLQPVTISASVATTQPLWIGKDPNGKFFKGVLDDVCLYAGALANTDVKLKSDADSDELPDWWEVKYFGTAAVNNGDGDNDAGGVDGLTNKQEYKLGTNPTLRDTDNDGYNDGLEVTIGFNPLKAALPDPSGLYINLNLFTPLE